MPVFAPFYGLGDAGAGLIGLALVPALLLPPRAQAICTAWTLFQVAAVCRQR